MIFRDNKQTLINVQQFNECRVIKFEKIRETVHKEMCKERLRDRLKVLE